MHSVKRPHWMTGLVIVSGAFGAMTIYSGGAVLFVDGAARAAAGNYVPFVLWFNFMAGFAYLIAAYGLFRLRPWTVPVSTAIAVLSLAVFAAFGVYVISGGAFEARTVVAMTVRCTLWIVIAIVLKTSTSLKQPR
ncbi:hypothetical protein [Magnetovibrio blakemorei]|uniref:Uncharacterized protein n=1 Tax=Magnetovibrio blakemorei TaxID=28181 RepID=A0A1E5Q7W8_9PROT|nr:hypothetical protein [Magnetovibrio blakemorei]OEJ67165.1 hypothetical protein BEN30_10340 [Magnetovibrio blakemorei]